MFGADMARSSSLSEGIGPSGKGPYSAMTASEKAVCSSLLKAVWSAGSAIASEIGAVVIRRLAISIVVTSGHFTR